MTLVVLSLKWKDLMLTFFDANQARSIGLNTGGPASFCSSRCSAPARSRRLQTVGACLVVAMLVTPGATAYLLTDRFGRLIVLSVAIGVGTSFVGAYISYFLDGSTGGVIVTLQTLLFLTAYVFAPKHGVLAARRRQLASDGAPRHERGRIDWLVEPLSYPFMQRALIVAIWSAPCARCCRAISC